MFITIKSRSKFQFMHVEDFMLIIKIASEALWYDF